MRKWRAFFSCKIRIDAKAMAMTCLRLKKPSGRQWQMAKFAMARKGAWRVASCDAPLLPPFRPR